MTIPLTIYAVTATEARRVIHQDDMRGALGAAYGAVYHRREDAEHARQVLDEERELVEAHGHTLRYWVVSLEPDEGGRIVASCQALLGCHSDGGTIPEAITMITDAIALHEHEAT